MLFLIGHGLLGAGVAASGPVVEPRRQITWTDPDRAARQLRDHARLVPVDGSSWSVAWCAGASTMRSTDAQMHAEAGHLEAFLDELRQRITPAAAASGVVFLASSAGGIHGRGSSGTITERTPVAPTTAYARGKLHQEDLLAAFHHETSVRCLVGRISNLFGTGQNLGKAQGLVSHVCRAAIHRRPLTVTVPLDTRRDYIHRVDAGSRIRSWIETETDAAPSVENKLIVSGRSATIAEIITCVHRVSRIRPLVVYAKNRDAESPRYQSFRSVTREDIDRASPCRSLEIGINQVWQSTWARFVNPSAPSP